MCIRDRSPPVRHGARSINRVLVLLLCGKYLKITVGHVFLEFIFVKKPGGCVIDQTVMTRFCRISTIRGCYAHNQHSTVASNSSVGNTAAPMAAPNAVGLFRVCLPRLNLGLGRPCHPHSMLVRWRHCATWLVDVDTRYSFAFVNIRWLVDGDSGTCLPSTDKADWLRD